MELTFFFGFEQWQNWELKLNFWNQTFLERITILKTQLPENGKGELEETFTESS